MKYLAQGHPASKWEGWDLNPGCVIPVSVLHLYISLPLAYVFSEDVLWA